VPKRKARSAAKGGPIDQVTGEKVFENTGESYVSNKGKTVVKTESSTKLAEAKNAHDVSSGTPIESLYADYSNSLKNMANKARLELLATPSMPYSPTARVAYANEVTSLNHKLDKALRNRPLERQAQLLANAIVDAKRRDNPAIDNADLKKIKGQALITARARVGARKEVIDITPSEWAAIQAGAISTNKLEQILDNADPDKVKAFATPRSAPAVNPSKLARAKSLLDSGYTQAEVADAIGVAVSTLNAALKREGVTSG
jgi:hypothetical protein